MTPDPYLGSISVRTTKAVRNPRLNAGELTDVIVIAGQSNCCNTVIGAGDIYTPTNASKVDNVSLDDGGTYAALDPLLGCDSSAGSFMGRLADKRINAGYAARVILAPIGVSSTSITRWKQGGDLNYRILVACRRLAAIGLSPTMFLWVHGESDHGMPRATYAANMQSVIATPRAEGYNAPWLIGVSTFDGTSSDATVAAACGDVVNGTTIFAGANTDTITSSTYRQTAPSPHFNPTGADQQATLWHNAIHAAGL